MKSIDDTNDCVELIIFLSKQEFCWVEIKRFRADQTSDFIGDYTIKVLEKISVV